MDGLRVLAFPVTFIPVYAVLGFRLFMFYRFYALSRNMHVFES
jgi:hypothetical protein